MKITKFVHSCLLIETPERVGIIDPGQFSWESGLCQVDSLQRLDDIVITHEHFDHLHRPFIQALLAKFPQALVTTTPVAADLLQKAGVQNLSVTGNEFVQLFASNHEPTQPFGPPPQNVGVHYLGKLTHPGDCHHFSECRDILALPVTAPWGSFTEAAELGLRLKPKVIIPIHDWHWNETARRNSYDTLEAFFAKQGIKFIKTKDGSPVEL